MLFWKSKKTGALLLSLSIAAMAMLAGCGADNQKPQARPVAVKAMKVIQQDAPAVSEFAGQLVGKNEVKVQAKVSGTIVEKYIQGGQVVEAGQVLYKIDSRQYESAVLTNEANLARSEANLNNAVLDLSRDESLLANEAISEQAVTTQRANVAAYRAASNADAALLRRSQEDLDDTVVRAPMSGRLSVDDVAVGTYAAAGNTTLVTIGNIDPIYAQFSISEAEYLGYAGMKLRGAVPDNATVKVNITTSDGRLYPFGGTIDQVDRALGQNTGTVTIKALFPNPDGLLLPGMFARVRLSGETIHNAILVPERAVMQLLGKSFVMVVDENNKSKAKTVKLGTKIGSYFVVEEGVDTNDTIIVEGLSNIQEGRDLDVTMVTPEEMRFSLDATDSTAAAAK